MYLLQYYISGSVGKGALERTNKDGKANLEHELEIATL
jgi:hypothetical protein